MFPTDYEKQNPLTKKKAMVKYFKKLEKMSLIDKYQSNYLINNTNKESYMDNYYKTTKNTGNLLNSYEFQRQFIKSKKKYKFMKKIRQKQILLESQDINNNNLEYNIFTENKNMKKKDSTKFENVNNKILTYTNKNKNLMNTIKEKEEENINSKNSNIDYDISEILVKNKKKKKQKTSQYMRKTLFQQIKNEGIYDDSDEESEEESLESDNENESTNSHIVNNRQKEGFEISLLTNGLEHFKNKININNENVNNIENINNDKKSDMSLYSIKTDYKANNNINNNNINQ